MSSAGNPSERLAVITTKTVKFSYSAPRELANIFEDFGRMCNDAIRLAVEKKPKNRFSLIELAYQRLKGYGLHTHYILSACEVAFSIYGNRRRRTTSYVRKVFLKLDSKSYQLNHMILGIPTTPRNFPFLTLESSDFHSSFLDDPRLKRGSVAINEKAVSVAFSKAAILIEPIGFVGIDLNERNATVSGPDGYVRKLARFEEITEIKEEYKEARAGIRRKTRGDRRIAGQLLAKYGRREKNRTRQRLHNVTRQIVTHAEQNTLGIKMEDLAGIRKLYRRGNGQGAAYRGRMNSWMFGETRRLIEYKANWEGIPVWFVNPRGTSSHCPDCGSRVVRLADRKLYCPRCDKEWDRDVLASRNIMACAVPQARPSKGSCDGERSDDGSNPPSRWGEGNPGG